MHEPHPAFSLPMNDTQSAAGQRSARPNLPAATTSVQRRSSAPVRHRSRGRSHMLDELAGKRRQLADVAATDGEFAHRPRIGERDRRRSPWCAPRDAPSSPARCRCRRCIRPAGTPHRSCATARAAAAAGRCARPCRRESAATRWPGRGRRNRGPAPARRRPCARLRQRMVARHHQHEAVLAERIGLKRARIDGAGDDAEVGDAFGDHADDLVAQPLLKVDADIGMGG